MEHVGLETCEPYKPGTGRLQDSESSQHVKNYQETMKWQTATMLSNVRVFSSYSGKGLFLGDRKKLRVGREKDGVEEQEIV